MIGGNYRFAIAKDGIAALEQAKFLNPDIIFMDINLPKLDGLSAIQQNSINVVSHSGALCKIWQTVNAQMPR